MQEENDLDYTLLHEEFKSIYEAKITEFIEREGSSTLEFYKEIQEAQERDKFSEEALLGQIMLATTDFGVFMGTMREIKRGKTKK